MYELCEVFCGVGVVRPGRHAAISRFLREIRSAVIKYKHTHKVLAAAFSSRRACVSVRVCTHAHNKNHYTVQDVTYSANLLIMTPL